MPVGLKNSNAWGLFDMSGNVWEWTADIYQEDITLLNWDPWVSSGQKRVSRGGSWIATADLVRVAYRSRTAGDFRSGRLGFRLAR